MLLILLPVLITLGCLQNSESVKEKSSETLIKIHTDNARSGDM